MKNYTTPGQSAGFGYGMAEEVYQQSLAIELNLREIPFKPKAELLVFYKEKQLETRYVPDFMVFDKIVVEWKAVSQLHPDLEAQVFNDMRIARQPVGYLLNFGRKGELEWKRFILDDFPGTKEEKEKEHSCRSVPISVLPVCHP